jgi:hypothetical protein
MPTQKKKTPELKLCSNKHKNSPNAKNCWVCGEPLDQAKPQFIQKTNTVILTPPVPSNYVDINYAESECERYVPGRKRCDTKDPSGIQCAFYTMGCAIRAKRFKVKPALDTT